MQKQIKSQSANNNSFVKLSLFLPILALSLAWVFTVYYSTDEDRNSLLLVCPDQYAWVLQTLELEKSKSLTLHEAPWEGNTRVGREMHWASPLQWVLQHGAKVYQNFSGATFEESLIASARYSTMLLNTLLLALIFLIGYVVLPPTKALWLPIAFYCNSLIWVQFSPIMIDHPALILTSTMLLLVGLVGMEHKRPYVSGAISGLGAGIGIWISAANMLPILALVLLPTACVYIAIRSKQAAHYLPTAWVIWGITASITSVLAYYVEYGSHIYVYPEINNPFYSMALGGTGIFLAAISRSKYTRAHLAAAMLGAAIAVIPLIAFSILHLYPSPLTHYLGRFISLISEGKPAQSFAGFGPILVAGATLLIYFLTGKVRAGLIPLAISGYAAFFISVETQRFLPYFGAILAVLVIHSLQFIRGAQFKQIIYIVLLLQGAIGLIHILVIITLPLVDQKEFYGHTTFTARDASKYIAESTDSRTTPYIFSPPDLGPQLAFFSNGKATSGPYWESLPTLIEASRLSVMTNHIEQKKYLAQNGITHVVVSAKNLLLSYSATGQTNYFGFEQFFGNPANSRAVEFLTPLNTNKLGEVVPLEPYQVIIYKVNSE